MKKKVTAAISSILSIMGLVLVTYALLNKPNSEIIEVEELLILFSITLCCVSTLLYIRWTNFGRTNKLSEIEKHNISSMNRVVEENNGEWLKEPAIKKNRKRG